MQVFVPESRRAEIVVEVGRMEERQADPIEDTRHLEEPESNVGEGLRRSTLGGSEPAHADLKGGPLNAGSIVSGGQAPVEQTARPTHPDVNEEFSSEQAGISEGLVGVSGKIEAVKESQGVATGASQVALSASQEQEDILEAWRKRRRQELAALQGAPAGGSFHKRTPEPGAGLDQGVKRVVNQGATGLDMGDRGQGAENRPVPVRGSEEEDEELLKNLRKR